MVIALEVAENRALGGGCGIAIAKLPCELLDSLRLERAHSRADRTAQRERIELIALASTDQNKSLGSKPRRLMRDRQFAWLAGELARRLQLGEPRGAHLS